MCVCPKDACQLHRPLERELVGNQHQWVGAEYLPKETPKRRIDDQCKIDLVRAICVNACAIGSNKSWAIVCSYNPLGWLGWRWLQLLYRLRNFVQTECQMQTVKLSRRSPSLLEHFPRRRMVWCSVEQFCQNFGGKNITLFWFCWICRVWRMDCDGWVALLYRFLSSCVACHRLVAVKATTCGSLKLALTSCVRTTTGIWRRKICLQRKQKGFVPRSCSISSIRCVGMRSPVLLMLVKETFRALGFL